MINFKNKNILVTGASGGIGKEIVNALNLLDLPVIMGSVLVIAFMFILINIIVDIIYIKLDPRIKYRRTGVASFVNKFGKVVLVGDDTPKYIFFGYISAKDINKKGSWTNFNITTRPYVWSVPIENLKPIEEFKNER